MKPGSHQPGKVVFGSSSAAVRVKCNSATQWDTLGRYDLIRTMHRTLHVTFPNRTPQPPHVSRALWSKACNWSALSTPVHTRGLPPPQMANSCRDVLLVPSRLATTGKLFSHVLQRHGQGLANITSGRGCSGAQRSVSHSKKKTSSHPVGWPAHIKCAWCDPNPKSRRGAISKTLST